MAEFTENTDTLFLIISVTASSRPDGLNVGEAGDEPVANGDPATCLSAAAGAEDGTSSPAASKATVPEPQTLTLRTTANT